MTTESIALMAHLFRRAGFGATMEELERYAAKGYEETVEELLHPERQPEWDEERLFRDFPELQDRTAIEPGQIFWTHRLIETRRPLEEKMALFWHGVLCTGAGKADNVRQVTIQIDMFRRLGLGRFPDILVELSKDPAMLYYLDNTENHKGSINENYGRELLELFSLGVGMDGEANYTEDDVQACSRAFTGWGIKPPLPTDPYGPHTWTFYYDATDHDDGEKTFLGETGRWNGEDVIDILARQPATRRFIARHLYNFFVADEPIVPTWKDIPPRDPQAIETLEGVLVESDYDMRQVMRVLLNSDFFKDARFQKVKSPVEVVIGTVKQTGEFAANKPGALDLVMEMRYMGQDILNPPTVEGWHTGRDWIDSGTLVERINYTADQMGNLEHPGIRSIVDRLASTGPLLSPERLVDGCLDVLGGYRLPQQTRDKLVAHLAKGGDLDTASEEFGQRVAQTLQLIVATQEYQFA